jgi:GNAT superfamily N-acetyltransferase
MTIRPITDQAEAYAAHRIVGELIEDKDYEPGKPAVGESLLQRLVQQLLCNPRYVMLGAFDDRGAVMGYICGEVRPDIYDGELCAFELFWAVPDRYRRDGIGLALLNEWEKKVKSMGAVKSFMGLGAFCNPDKMRAIYSHLGYQLYSESYFKAI